MSLFLIELIGLWVGLNVVLGLVVVLASGHRGEDAPPELTVDEFLARLR